MLEHMAESEGIVSISSLVERSVRLMYATHDLVGRRLKRRV